VFRPKNAKKIKSKGAAFFFRRIRTFWPRPFPTANGAFIRRWIKVFVCSASPSRSSLQENKSKIKFRQNVAYLFFSLENQLLTLNLQTLCDSDSIKHLALHYCHKHK
jgi:hypothetical protein